MGDRNLVLSATDTLEVNQNAVYRALTQNGTYRDIRDGHSPDKHFGSSTTFTGFSYDSFQGKIEPQELKKHSTLDVGVTSPGFRSLMSFIHPGGYDPTTAVGTSTGKEEEKKEVTVVDAARALISLASYTNASARDMMESNRYFASDHALLGCDLVFEDLAH